MPFRGFDWPWAHHKLEGLGPIIDDAVIIPNTPLEEVGSYLDTPEQVAAWFGSTIDADHGSLTIARAPDTLTVAWIDTDLIDQGRCHTLTGIIATGQLRSYVSLRTVACQLDSAATGNRNLGYGTEIWTHIDLPLRTPQAIVTILIDVVRRGNRRLRGELGT